MILKPIYRLSLFILFTCWHSAGAQTALLTGTVSCGKDGVPAATVSLLKQADSTWVASDIADDNGAFSLKDIPCGKYLLATSATGYSEQMQGVAISEAKQTVNIELTKTEASLAEVSVVTKKPFIEMSLGKTVVNVEGTTTTAGTTVLEMLRRLPGVSVDQNGNVSMNGKQGVLMLVDDRPTYLSGDDLAQYLKTMTASETAQIELITQPGAKYDAAGNTGIINIKMKKNRKEGWNGSVTASYGQGIYFHRNESLSLNYKVKKLSLSLSANDMEAIGFADWTEHLYFTDPATGNVTGSSYVHSTPKERFSNTVARLTADYDVNDKMKIGTSVRSTYHPNSNAGYLLAGNYDATGTISSYNGITNADGFIRKDVMANAYMTYKIDKESALDINIDYLSSGKNAYQDLDNTSYNNQMVSLPAPAASNSKQLSAINVYSAKADYTYAFNNGLKMEAGAKSSAVTNDNNALFSLYDNGTWINDTGRTNRFNYTEQINAAYGTLSRKLGTQWGRACGLRAEQTTTHGIQYAHSDEFTRHYLSLFPTAYINYAMDSNDHFELSYGRRIERRHITN